MVVVGPGIGKLTGGQAFGAVSGAGWGCRVMRATGGWWSGGGQESKGVMGAG